MVAPVVDGPVGALTAARRDVVVEARVVERVSVRLVIAVSSPFAAIVFTIETVSERVLTAEKGVREDAVAAGMGEGCVGAVLFMQSREPRAARVILVFAISREDVFVEAAELLDSDGIDGETGVSNAGLAVIEALVETGAGDDVSIAAGCGFFSQPAEIARRERDVIVGDDDNVSTRGIRGQHAIIPASRDAAIDAEGMVDNQRVLRDAGAGLGDLRIAGVQEEMTLDGVGTGGRRRLKHACGACGRTIRDGDDGDLHRTRITISQQGRKEGNRDRDECASYLCHCAFAPAFRRARLALAAA